MEDNTKQSASIFKHSQEHIDFVNSLSLEDLRIKYLNAMYQSEIDAKNITKCVIVNKEEMRKDQLPGSTFYSWQSNIAMAFVDAFIKYAEDKEIEGTAKNFNIRKIANDAAINFLNVLCV